MLDPVLYQTVVNSMSAHVAILDEDGVIIDTNRAWQDFALQNGLKQSFDGIGINYFSVCDGAGEEHEGDGVNVARGIRKVLAGDLPEFLTHYPCHSPEERRWYTVRVVPFRSKDTNKVIVTHENITQIIEIQETLEKKEAELRSERERLEETNIALRVLLRQRDEDKKRVEETIYVNVDRLVLPYVEQLLLGRLSEKHRTLIEVVDNNLRDIVSPFLRSLTTVHTMLTPQEIEVAHMVRSGRSSKEIAGVLGISVSGVDFHRKKLRQKLGLTNKPNNLRSHLLSLENDG